MFKTPRSSLDLLTVPGGESMPFAIFMLSVAPLVALVVIAYAVLVEGLLGSYAPIAMIAGLIIPMALIFVPCEEGTLKKLKKLKDDLDQVWRAGWISSAFAVLYYGLSSGTDLSVDSLLRAVPLQVQTILFVVLGCTLAAQLGLGLVVRFRNNQDA